jgi:arylsulfatase
MDMITGKGPSARHEIFYFAESTLGAVRIDDYKYSFTLWEWVRVRADRP